MLPANQHQLIRPRPNAGQTCGVGNGDVGNGDFESYHGK
jgi:hypothetical protein